MNEVLVVIAMTKVFDNLTIEHQMIGNLVVIIMDHPVMAMKEVHVISQDLETTAMVLETNIGLIVKMIAEIMIKVDHLVC